MSYEEFSSMWKQGRKECLDASKRERDEKIKEANSLRASQEASLYASAGLSTQDVFRLSKEYNQQKEDSIIEAWNQYSIDNQKCGDWYSDENKEEAWMEENSATEPAPDPYYDTSSESMYASSSYSSSSESSYS